MKNLILLTTVLFSMNAFASNAKPTVNEKVLKTFHQIFKDAHDVHWSATANYNEAAFESGDVKTKAVFDDKGNLVQTVRYYKEDKLPSNILYNLQKQYCHDVWGVTEISNTKGTTYNVVLKCNKYWYNVKANSIGNVRLVNKLTRADN